MTTSCNPFMELPDQLGYVQCSFCATILLVSVPCNSLLKVVTVKCGHCTCLLSVSLEKQQHDGNVSPKPCNNGEGGEEDEEEGKEKPLLNTVVNPLLHPVVNKPPEKRQRAPSAYNCFIKEEIQRIKAREPSITHKEAFSTAAKNWAHFPRFQHKQGKGETCSFSNIWEWINTRNGGLHEADRIRQGFRERKASRQSL